VRPLEVLENQLINKKSYFCYKCRQKHYYNSSIGSLHTKYITASTQIIRRISKPTSTKNLKKTLKSNIKKTELSVSRSIQPRKVSKSTKTDIIENNFATENKISHFINGYIESYKKGVENFGVWWTIFQVSIWSFALIFFLLAAIILVVYLPKIEMIYWEL
jgi:hypothetical protein